MGHKRLKRRRNQIPLLPVNHILHLISGATMRHSEQKWKSGRTRDVPCLLYEVVVLANCGSSATRVTVDVTVQATVLTFFCFREKEELFSVTKDSEYTQSKMAEQEQLFSFHIQNLRPSSTNLTHSNHLTQRDLSINYLTCDWLMIFSKIQHNVFSYWFRAIYFEMLLSYCLLSGHILEQLFLKAAS